MAEHVCESCIRRARHRSVLVQVALELSKWGLVFVPVVIRWLS